MSDRKERKDRKDRKEGRMVAHTHPFLSLGRRRRNRRLLSRDAWSPARVDGTRATSREPKGRGFDQGDECPIVRYATHVARRRPSSLFGRKSASDLSSRRNQEREREREREREEEEKKKHKKRSGREVMMVICMPANLPAIHSIIHSFIIY